MKKIAIFFVAAFSSISVMTPASAQSYYASGNLGFTWGGGEDYDFGVDLVLDSGYMLGGAFGIKNPNSRFEGEIAYRENDMESWGGVVASGSMSSLAFMANAYYDFGDDSWSFRPYVGIGGGLASITMNSSFYNTYDTVGAFALQLMLGGSIPLSEGFAMSVELRSFGAIPTFTDAAGVSYDQGYGVGSLLLGFRQTF